MRTMKKTMAALAVVALMGAAGTALAAGPVSAVATGTADIVFAASGTATVNITPVTGLMAGSVADKTKLADVAIDVTAGAPAWRWTPGSGTITNTTSIASNELTGKAGNKINVQLINSAADSTLDTASGWWVLNSTVTNKLHKDLLIVKNQTATVAPDTYPVSVDAVVWAY
ncbi:TPA: hypothetical protein ACJ2XP_004761 [Enterobacter cloacae]|uniref:hypothetical protein n=2 Tax=Enterobacter cloacae TaxID=550 RepID=UPI00188D6227|nr:hypothetical protein [Enterobacter cloacae]MBF4114151.1 hypothetical protein [Enterobacter cloacae]